MLTMKIQKLSHLKEILKKNTFKEEYKLIRVNSEYEKNGTEKTKINGLKKDIAWGQLVCFSNFLHSKLP